MLRLKRLVQQQLCSVLDHFLPHSVYFLLHLQLFEHRAGHIRRE